MKYRVSNAPTNLTRRFEARYRSQRQGQALLLAVVVMLFVALISAGFLATVAGNLNQTARTSEKNRAIESAKAGMRFINDRINSSAEGENWRPLIESPFPLITDANYNNYYTPMAQIQGLGAAGYSKFPAANSSTADVPQFYAKVERIAYDTATRTSLGQSNDAERAGQLKITVVGLGRTDPNVFHRMVSYRGGYEGAPIGRVARAVANYDFRNKVVPVSGLSTATALNDVTLTLDTNLTKGDFPTKDFTVSISSPTSNLIQTVVVSSRTGSNLQLATPVTQNFPVGSRVELAASIGAPKELNYTRDTNATPTLLPLPDLIADQDPLTIDSTVQSARVNGGVRFEGNAKITGLLAPVDAYNTGTAAPRTIESSGFMEVIGTGILAGKTAATNAPNSAAFPTAAGDVISDGYSNITGDLGTTRKTKAFTPPDLTSETNLKRYRGLTRDSKSLIATLPEAGIYGKGEGIYIDNVTDREKFWSGTQFVEMNQQQLRELWTAQTTAADQYRLSTPAVLTLADKSLEDKHLRGWVGTDEFRPRGATIELFDKVVGATVVPTIAITRDPLIDELNATNANDSTVPSTAKTWKSTDVSSPTTLGNPQPGVYREEFPFNSTNGVIFAEGNVRIKGIASGVNKSLTVVSLGNIYIEGSLNIASATTQPRKVLLLARKNVVVNPTSVISRVDGFTQATGAATTTAGVTEIPVADVDTFNIGDWIRVGATATPVRVTSIGATSIFAQGTVPAVAGDIVRAASDSVNAATRVPTLNQFDGVIQRRIPKETTGIARLTLRHGAVRREVATVNFIPDATTPVPPTSATATAKYQATFTAPKINQGDKTLVVSHSTTPPGPGTDTFNLADKTSLTALKTDMEGASYPTGGATWKYQLDIDAGFEDVPAFYLAGFGSRRPRTLNNAAPWLQNLLTPPGNELILATSVDASFYDGTNRSQFGTTGAAPETAVSTFGFSPTIVGANATESEDVSTVDSSFYSLSANDYKIESRQITQIPTATNTFSLKFNQPAPIAPAVVAPITEAQMPPYHFNGMRLERIGADETVSGPGIELNINAYVYAQTGSWFVIPGGYFDDRIRVENSGSYIDYDNSKTPTPNTGEYVDVSPAGFGAGDYADINGNGIMDPREANIGAQLARYNYQINFNGTIAENLTPVINTVGTGATLVEGTVADWMDKWTSYTTSVSPTNPLRPINYLFDEDYARGLLDANPLTPSDPIGPQAGFYMPVANDILYQE